ncbi:MAG: glycogen/starch synthase, partial [Chloroflexi bacterium]|nr:glycogen/starch synthase [Chloroflexota bacterium]
MNVCMLSPEYPPYVVGGLGAHVAHLAPELANLGVRVHVVTPRLGGGESEEAQVSGLDISRVAGKDLPRDFFERTAILNDYLYGRAAAIVGTQPGPWLLHAHDWIVAEAATRLQRDYSLPLLATIHATEYGRNQGIHSDLQARVHEQER